LASGTFIFSPTFARASIAPRRSMAMFSIFSRFQGVSQAWRLATKRGAAAVGLYFDRRATDRIAHAGGSLNRGSAIHRAQGSVIASAAVALSKLGRLDRDLYAGQLADSLRGYELGTHFLALEPRNPAPRL
ncbi:hypothetical protein B4Q13_17575, partial [Lacticaseibacillus rhamnosus]